MKLQRYIRHARVNLLHAFFWALIWLAFYVALVLTDWGDFEMSRNRPAPTQVTCPRCGYTQMID